MITLKLKKTFSNQLLFKINRSKTWSRTISMVDSWTDKKIAYAGGCGYDKQGACLNDFLFNHFEQNEYTKVLSNKIGAGMFTSMFDYIKDDEIVRFFKYLGYIVEVNKLDNGKYPIYLIKVIEKNDEILQEKIKTLMKD